MTGLSLVYTCKLINIMSYLCDTDIFVGTKFEIDILILVFLFYVTKTLNFTLFSLLIVQFNCTSSGPN